MKTNIYINNGIADKMAPAYRVTALLRSLDDRGCGQVISSLTTLSVMLGVTRKTTRRNLIAAMSGGLLHELHLNGDTVTVKYVSTKRLACVDTGLRSLVPTHLAVNHLRLAATRAEACYRTRRHHSKLRLLPKSKGRDEMFRKSILTYDDLLAVNGRWLRSHRQGYSISNPNIVHTGASQQTVANALERHRSTVNRRLKSCNRDLCEQPHYRIYRLHNLIDLPEGVVNGLLDNSYRYGRYTLTPGGIVWENKTCIYPFEPFANAPQSVPQSVNESDNKGEPANPTFNEPCELNVGLATPGPPPRRRFGRRRCAGG